MPEKLRPGRYEVIKTYPQRGPLQQYRVASATAFGCFRCGRTKTSKLVTVFRGDWERLLCNGCYGRLLALHEARAGEADTTGAAQAMSEQLLLLVPEDDARMAEDRIRLRDDRVQHLEPKTLRLLATAEYVATQLVIATDLDWSAAVIGLCKAVEIEVVGRLVDPLAAAADGLDLSIDIADKDLGRVARYCAGRSAKPPELGSIRHFLSTAENSQQRRETSPLLVALRNLAQQWPRGDWIFAGQGAVAALEALIVRYRNPAAHTEELTEADYHDCADLVSGDDGLLWILVLATSPR